MLHKPPNFFSKPTIFSPILQVADQWEVPSCVDACKEFLLGLSDSHFPIQAVFSLPSHFYSNDVFQELLAEADVCLRNEFGDAVSCLRNISRLHKFTQLPYQAILALLKCDSLTTDDEATVLLLVYMWFDSNRATCSTEQLQQLKSGVRYSRLSVPFICCMLPLMPDFQVTLQQANELCMFKSFADCSNANLVNLRLGGACPNDWYLAVRDNEIYKTDAITLTLEVSEFQLLAHVAAVAKMRAGGDPPPKISSEKEYGFGYDWVLSLSSNSVPTALSIDVEVFSHTDSQALAVAVCEITFMFPGTVDEDEDEDEDGDHTIDAVVTSNSPASVTNMFGIAAAVLGGDRSLGPWEQFLVGGVLCLEASLRFK